MTDASPCVFIVDDEESVRKSLARLLRTAGFKTETFPTAIAFLEAELPDAPSCLVLDVQMPELDGLQLQSELNEGHIALPIIFITGHGNIPMTVQAFKSGAVDLLVKPFEDSDLLRAVRQAIELDIRNRASRSDVTRIEQRTTLLSRRERQVMEYVVSGSLNKQIARHLGVTEKTIKVHRGHVMKKMQAGSLAELVRMAQKVGIQGPQN